MANYITTLREELAQLRRQCMALQEGILDLEVYLDSPKFANDSYVNKSDVLARLSDAKTAALDAYYQA